MLDSRGEDRRRIEYFILLRYFYNVGSVELVDGTRTQAPPQQPLTPLTPCEA